MPTRPVLSHRTVLHRTASRVGITVIAVIATAALSACTVDTNDGSAPSSSSGSTSEEAPYSGSDGATVSVSPGTGQDVSPGEQRPLAGAQLWVPEGWSTYADPNGDGDEAICLTDSDGQSAEDCRIRFVLASSQVDVDSAGGLQADPQYCPPSDSGAQVVLDDYGSRPFGGRQSDYRQWVWTCSDGTVTTAAQFVSPEAAGYILFSDQVDETILGVMSQIAQQSALPAVTGTVRLYDYGEVVSVELDGEGATLELNRVIRNDPDPIDDNDATYTYQVPASVVGGTSIEVGKHATLTSDGSVVTSLLVS